MITTETQQLWQRIQQFQLDEPNVTLPFSRRLMREQDWSIQYTFKAIEEYKRFIFLMCISHQSITPSETVDTVWHLHLLYTKSYWDEFCEKLLQKRIHHNPSKGGKIEGQKFIENYEKTLQLYETYFGIKPPEEIWPSAQKRFARKQYQWVNRKEWWLIPKSFNVFCVKYKGLFMDIRKQLSRLNY